MKVFRPLERSLVGALSLNQTLLSRVQQEGHPFFAVSVVHGPAVILGAMQRTGRVVNLQACADASVPVLRRATTGTAAWIGGAGIIMALALPHVATIKEDATAQTVLNRNVRPFLQAFSQAGAMAHYFGREWISIRKQPTALLGFDISREGGVLVEVLVGFDESIALPTTLTTDDERAVDRFPGKTPTSLREVLPDARIATWPDRFNTAFLEGVARQTSIETDEPALPRHMAEEQDEMQPWPGGYSPHSLLRVPIGYLDVGACASPGGGHPCLGGDVLAPRWLYWDVTADGFDAADPYYASLPVIGAKFEDFVRAVKSVTTKEKRPT